MLFSIVILKEFGIRLASSGSRTCFLKVNMWDKSGSVIPAFRGVILDSSLILFFLNIFSIWLFGIIGKTLDSIIRWAGRTIGLISVFKLFMTTDLCLSVRFATV